MCGVRDLLPWSCISDGLAPILVPVRESVSGGRVMRVFRTHPLCALPSDNEVSFSVDGTAVVRASGTSVGVMASRRQVARQIGSQRSLWILEACGHGRRMTS